MLSLPTILATAFVTYCLRLGGLLLAERLPKSPGFQRFMDALPGAVLVSLVVPGILQEGFSGVIAAACTAICRHKTRNVFVAMALGMAVVALAHLMA